MRIISGTHKGRRIQAPKKLPVRPTTDRAKEGLFNILQHRIEFSTSRVLDLFSGTGNMSYEFASRHCIDIMAVDQNFHCVQFIKKTAVELKLSIDVVQSESLNFLENTVKIYDIIFADPPYDFETAQYNALIHLGRERIDSDGHLIIEHFEKVELDNQQGFDFKRAYGNSNFSFFKK
jgi:16S rRNA (guanine966-N2)-methyltransferase